MRLVFTTIFTLFICSFAIAQINEDSPFPADFAIDSPAAIAGTYDYGTQVANADNAIWGEAITETVMGELVWAYDATDSLACEAVITDLTGKFALIRRGACGFSTKCLNAQNAGAIAVVIVNHFGDDSQNGESLVGMLGGDIGADVTIPAVFVGRNTGALIAEQLANGETVNAAFRIKSFYDPISSFSYQTPLEEAIEVGIFRINYVNPNPDETITVTASATITAPSGAETVLTGISEAPPVTEDTIFMEGSFTPTELGEHTIVWSHDQSAETQETKFIMTEQTFAVNRDNPTLPIGPSDETFTNDYNFVYQVGALVLPDDDGASVSYASFGLANAAELFTGDTDADLITVILYDADADDDEVIDLDASFQDLSPVGIAEYRITGNEGSEELIYVELEDLDDGDNIIDLKPGGAYYIVIAYDGVLAGTGIAPSFLGSRGVNYLPFPTTPLFLDQMYTGWANSTVAVQLHLNGFVAPVATEDIVSLDAAKVSAMPNPVENELNVAFLLDEVADKVNINIVDVRGKVLSTYQFNQVYQNNVQIDMENFTSGVYFLSISTPEGFRSLKVVKL